MLITQIESSDSSRLFIKSDFKPYKQKPYFVNIRTADIQLSIQSPIEDFYNKIIKKLAKSPQSCVTRHVLNHEFTTKYPKPNDLKSKLHALTTPQISENYTLRNKETIIDYPQQWIPVDIDKFDISSLHPHPEYKNRVDFLFEVKNSADDKRKLLEDTVEEIINLYLPPLFHNTSYVVKFSSSCLANHSSLSMHLFFLSKESYYSQELRQYFEQLKYQNESSPIDSAIYRHAQAIFTADPKFVSLPDPFEQLGLTSDDRSFYIIKENQFITESLVTFSDKDRKIIHHKVHQKTPVTQLSGFAGFFNRTAAADWLKLLTEYNYIPTDREDRYVAPESESDSAGVVLFPNGYVYSFHSEDHCVIAKTRRPLSPYDFVLLTKYQGDVNAMNIYVESVIYDDSTEYEKFKKYREDELYERYHVALEFIENTTDLAEKRGLTSQILKSLIFLYYPVEMLDEFFASVAKLIGKKPTDIKAQYKYLQKEVLTQRAISGQEIYVREGLSELIIAHILFNRMGTKRFWAKEPSGTMRHYNSKYWRVVNDAELYQLLQKNCKDFNLNFVAFHGRVPENIFREFKRLMPLRNEFQESRPYLGFKDCALDISDEEKVSTVEHSPEQYLVQCYPFNYTPKAKCHLMDRFLSDSFKADPLQAKLFWQWCGYQLSHINNLQKYAMFYGPQGSGKSVASEILKHIAGIEYAINTSIESMSDRFGLEDHLGKKSVIIAEAEFNDKSKDNAIFASRFKSLTAKEAYPVKVKYGDTVQLVNPPKYTVVTNNEMSMAQFKSDSIIERGLFFSFPYSIRGTDKEDPFLLSKILEGELPGMVNKAIMGLYSLKKDGKFVVTDSHKESKYEQKSHWQTLQVFMNELFESDDKHEEPFKASECIPIHLLKSSWAAYLTLLRKHEFTEGRINYLINNFLSELRQTYGTRHPIYKKERTQGVMRIEGRLVKSYLGFRIRPSKIQEASKFYSDNRDSKDGSIKNIIGQYFGLKKGIMSYNRDPEFFIRVRYLQNGDDSASEDFANVVSMEDFK